MTKQINSFDQSIESYSSVAKAAKKSNGTTKMLAFGAAAAGGLFAANIADADIVHTGPSAGFPGSIGAGQSATVDVDLDGDADFGFFHLTHGGVGSPGFAINVQGGGNSEYGAWQVGGTSGGYNHPQQMVYSSPISSNNGAPFSGGTFTGTAGAGATGWMGWASTSTAFVTDPWGVIANPSSTQTGIIGLKFIGATVSGGQAQVNGWIQIALHVTSTGNGQILPGSFTLLDMAYENMGNPIGAGHTGIPEPAAGMALALLALGAVGIRRRRQAKKTA